MLENEIYNSLNKKFDELKDSFFQSNTDFGCRFFFVDNLLPEETAIKISNKFPSTGNMRYLNSYREKKYTSKDFNKFDNILEETALALQSKKVIEIIEKITCIKQQVGDPMFYAGGLSAMSYKNFLNPHIDNSHNYQQSHYRTLNLLYYVTQDWTSKDGGHLELWDKNVKKNKTIESSFNRLIVMETNPLSWHSVSRVTNKVKARNCISNYYFSKISPINKSYSNVTSFNGRPGQILNRIICKVDNKIRQSIRFFKKKGFSKIDLNIQN